MPQRLNVICDQLQVLQKPKAPLLLFAANLCIVFVSYCLFAHTHFTTDSYAHMEMTAETVAGIHISGGRWLNALIVLAMDALGIRSVLDQQFGFTVLVIVLAFCATLLVCRVKSSLQLCTTKKIVLFNCVFLISFVNVFTAELFYYPEATVLYACGILLATIPVFILTKTWSLRRILVSCSLLILSISVYQAFFESFIILSLGIMLIQNDFRFSKPALFKTLKALLVGMSGVIIAVPLSSLVIMLLGVSKQERFIQFDPDMLLVNIKNVFWFHHYYFFSAGMFSVVLRTLCLCILIVLAIQLVLRIREKRFLDFLFIVALLAGSYVLVFTPHFFAQAFWPAPRTLVPFFSWLSLVAITALSISEKELFRSVIISSCVFFLCLNIFWIQQIAANQLILNAMDRQYASRIIEEIEKYEESSGYTVTRFAYSFDAWQTPGHTGYTWLSIYNIGDSARHTSWSMPGLLHYVSGRQFESIPMDKKVFDQFFAGKDWDSFVPEEQMYFIDNTLYLVCY